MAYAAKDSEDSVKPRKSKGTMSDDDVRAFLGRKIEAAMNQDGGDLSASRQENFNYYIGAEYGNEREGYSKVVTREVLETVEWVLPSVLRVFTAGDRVVTFDPAGPQDEGQAEQETDITNYQVLKANKGKGFLSLHHWFKDTLMYPNGYIKAYMEECTVTDTGEVTGLDALAVQRLKDDPEVEILEQESRVVMLPMPPQMAQPGAQGPPQLPQAELFDLKIKTTKQRNELRLMPVPPEECLVDPDCTSLDLDEADCVTHRTKKTYTALILEGYDADKLDMVGNSAQDGYDWGSEKVSRMFYTDEQPATKNDSDDDSMREFWVHESHVWMDYDKDGVAEFRRVCMIGDQIFENEETNYQPMIALSAILMPHKHNGMSYADLVKDLQLLMSTLKRQLLDNIYKINIRRKAFSEDSLTEDGSTMAAMLNTNAEFIPVKGRAQDAFFPEPNMSIVAEILPVMQYVDEQKNMRSGVAPTVALDPEVIQESTVGAFTQAVEQASQRVEMLVRIFAETGVKTLMLKVHQLMRMHQDIATTVKIRGNWIPVDPQGWRDRTDMTANVGLGYNNKPQMIQLLTQLLGMQKEALAGNLTDAAKIFNTFQKLIHAAGLGDVNQYFADPKQPGWQPPQPPPDPNMILAQAQAQALGAESQRKAQKDQQDFQLAQMKLMADHQYRQSEQQLGQADRVLTAQKMTHAVDEFRVKHGMDLNETAATIRNKDADSELKMAQAVEARAKAGQTAIEASDVYREATQIVANQGSEDGTDSADTPVH